MSDGVRLAARLCLPDALPAPVVIEALPYRMDDLTASYDEEYRRICEEGGLAVCRIDLRGPAPPRGSPSTSTRRRSRPTSWRRSRGSRRSSGRRDASGCTGRPGAGSTRSRSRWNARPRSARSSPSTPRTTATRTTSTTWAACSRRSTSSTGRSTWRRATSLPPTPAVYGEGWREEWLRRIEGTEPWLLRWLDEQSDGPYWRHGSVRPRYERIECATMIVGGWADGYTNIALRGYEALRCPRRVLVGPWSHMSPATSIPGPHIDLVPEIVRWFDAGSGTSRTGSTRSRRSSSSGAARRGPRRISRRCAASGGRNRRGRRSGDARSSSGRVAPTPTPSRSAATSASPPGSRAPGSRPGTSGRPTPRRRALARVRLGAARGRARLVGHPRLR